MPRRRTNPTKYAETKLAKARIKAGVTQADMARWLGLSLRHYRRIETTGPKPYSEHRSRLRLVIYVNCALVLRVPFDDVAPDDWQTTWTKLSRDAPDGPPPLSELEASRRAWE